MMMMIDKNSILNSPVFDKDYMDKKRESELEEYLKREELNMEKDGDDVDDGILNRDVDNDVNSLD
jgi:hypothetical protein